MQIRHIEPAPEQHYFLMTNAAARDARLSYRARGLMAVIVSHSDGFHISSEELAEGGKEGIKAIRTAMNELVDCNYMRRVRSQDAGGRWRTDIDFYRYGDAPPIRGTADEVLDAVVMDEDFTDEPFLPVGLPPTQNRQAVKVHVREDHLEDHSSVPVVAALPTDRNPTTEVPVEGAAAASQTVQGRVIPTVLQRKLVDMGVTDGSQWTAAWVSATSLEWPPWAADEAGRFPSEHLMLHLMAQQEQRREPSPSRWLRFYIEDRNRRIQIIAGQLEQERRMAETPEEREARQNRALPPQWDTPTGETR